VKRLQRELADLEHTVRSEDRDDETVPPILYEKGFKLKPFW